MGEGKHIPRKLGISGVLGAEEEEGPGCDLLGPLSQSGVRQRAHGHHQTFLGAQCPGAQCFLSWTPGPLAPPPPRVLESLGAWCGAV